MNLITHLSLKLGLIVVFFVSLAACSAIDVLNATVSKDTYRLIPDIAYGSADRQNLDLYLPINLPTQAQTDSQTAAGGAPLVVFFYGGSWSSGDKADYRFVGESLASQGIAVMVADYRLSPLVRYPVFVEDSALAVRWAFDNARKYGSDPKRIFVMGHSAGAYNAAMVAMDARWLAAVNLSPSELAGWIGLAGPYDFLPIGDPKTQIAFQWPNTPANSQPLTHASSMSPPALLIGAADDNSVNPQRNTVALASKLKSNGVKVEMELFDTVGHVTLIAAMAKVLRGRAPVLERVSGFINDNSNTLK